MIPVILGPKVFARHPEAVREKLGKKGPASVGRQVDIPYSCWRADTTPARGGTRSEKEAQSQLEKGRDIPRRLKERVGLGPQQGMARRHRGRPAKDAREQVKAIL
jgi:hypothetical protein